MSYIVICFRGAYHKFIYTIIYQKEKNENYISTEVAASYKIHYNNKTLSLYKEEEKNTFLFLRGKAKFRWSANYK